MALDWHTKNWLTDRFGDKVRFDEPMSRHTSLKVGGPADAYVTPETENDLALLVRQAHRTGLPCRTIGGGTNLLVKDGGIRGLVIALSGCFRQISYPSAQAGPIRLRAGAGARTSSLCTCARDHGWAGLNFAVGIPGTMGGAVQMNAGTGRGEMSEILTDLRVMLPTGETRELGPGQMEFSYRNLKFRNCPGLGASDRPIILEAGFRLSLSDPESISQEAETIRKMRTRNQPSGLPGAGSFFKNPPTGKTAGQLMDLAGLKGQKIGGAEISSKHANFFLNRNQASASDILALMDLARKTVSTRFGIDLEPEVKIVGE